MSGDDAALLPDLSATLALPLWAVGVGVAFVVTIVILAAFRGGATKTLGMLGRYALILFAVVAAVVALARLGQQERGAERRALDMRAMELTARVIAPGSALSCLDANAGETVALSCEKAVFAKPETVASGVAYVAAQLNLLADGIDYVNRVDPNYEFSLGALQRAIESDRFGFVAQVLSVRDGCTAEKCESFTLLRDASRVQANLKEQTFQRFVGRNAAAWASESQTSQADAPAQGVPVAGARPHGTPSSTTLNFPTAASIPPVSIMNAEPGTPSGSQSAQPAPAQAAAPSGSAASADPAANPPTPRRPASMPRRPAPSPPQAAAPPVQLTPQPAAPQPGEANAGSPTRAQ
jgi:hypothetical protein